MRMKKNLLIALFFIAVLPALAQEDTDSQVYNKKGIALLPEQGDWVIGIDASPFLNYIGNVALISSMPNNAPDFAFTAQRPGQLFAKYYVSDRKAFRLGLRLGVTILSSDVNDEDDKLKENSLDIGLSFGAEHHRTIRGRLRGYFGYEFGIYKTPYNGLNWDDSQMVTGKVELDDSDDINSFIESGGNSINIVARGLVGIEYFVAPNISLSGEFGLGLGYENMSERSYNPNEGSTVVYDRGYSLFSIANTASGAIVLFFHF